MESKVELNAAARRIEVKVAGDLDSVELGSVTDETLRLVAERRVFNVLVDLAAMDNAPLASALQRLPDYYASRGVDRRMRIAVVLPERGDAQGLASFYKLAARRRAYRVNVFETRIAADAWLRKENL